jgi:hypothetical protein
MVLAVRQGEQCDSGLFPIAPGKPAADGIAGRGEAVQRVRGRRALPRTLLASNSNSIAFIHVDIMAGGGRISSGQRQTRSSETAKEGPHDECARCRVGMGVCILFLVHVLLWRCCASCRGGLGNGAPRCSCWLAFASVSLLLHGEWWMCRACWSVAVLEC